jgi:hypothetical protein
MLLTKSPGGHDYAVCVDGNEALRKRLRKSPWAYEKSSSSYILPGFALSQLGINPDSAVAQNPLQLVSSRRAGVAGSYVACDLDIARLCLKRPLWKFQREDVLSMCNHGAWGEFAQVGLGKTICTLSAYTILRNAGRVDGLLVLGPESARHSWVGRSSDTNEFGHPNALVTSGKPIPTSGVVFCSYDKSYRPQYASELLKRVRDGRWILALDEAHMVSNTSNRFKAISFWAPYCPWRWLLTGTPVSNYPDKFFALWHLLTLSKCTLEQWKLWFQRASGEWNVDRLRGLREYLKRISVVRTRAEVAPYLPKTIVRTINVEMEGEQRTLYHSMISKDSIEMNGEKVRAHDWNTKLVHLSSIAAHPQLPFTGCCSHPTAKLQALQEVLEQLEGEKVVIWSWRPRVLQWLQGVLKDKSVLYVGETTKKGREEAILAFNEDPDVRLFLGNPSAAGAGLNLPVADFCCFLDADWSSVDVDQAMGRIERGIGYKRAKTQIRFVSARTVEATCWEAVERKKGLATHILGGERQHAEAQRRNIVSMWMQGSK